MTNARVPVNFIDLTGDATDEEEPNISGTQAAARPRNELASRSKSRDQPSRIRQHEETKGDSSDDSSNMTDTMVELSRKWQARPRREASAERRSAPLVNGTAHKNESGSGRANGSVTELPQYPGPTVLQTRLHQTQQAIAPFSPSRAVQPLISSQATHMRKNASQTSNWIPANAPTSLGDRCGQVIPPSPSVHYADSVMRALKRTANGEVKPMQGSLSALTESVPRDALRGDPKELLRSASAAALYNRLPVANHTPKSTATLPRAHEVSGTNITRPLNSHPQAHSNNHASPVSRVTGDTTLLATTLAASSIHSQSTSEDELLGSVQSRHREKLKKLVTNDRGTPLMNMLPMSPDRAKKKVPPPVAAKDEENAGKSGSSASTSSLFNAAIKSTLENGRGATVDEIKHLKFLIEKVWHTGRDVRVQDSTIRQPVTPEEDELTIFLKERTNLTWLKIHEYFPARKTWHSIQGRYSKVLQQRPRESGGNPGFDKSSTGSNSSCEPEVGAKTGQRRRSTRLVNWTKLNGNTSFFDEYLEVESNRELLAEPSAALSRAISENSPILTEPQPRRRTFPSRTKRHLSVDESEMFTGEFGNDRVQPWKLTSRKMLAEENERDAAALSSLTLRISRLPIPQKMKGQHINHDNVRRVTKSKRRSLDVQRPYLDYSERKFLASSVQSRLWDTGEAIDWEGKVLHVDFLDDELKTLEPSICAIKSVPPRHQIMSIREWAQKVLKQTSEQDISRISRHAQHRGVFLNRTVNSINGFLRDLAKSTLNNQPSFQKLKLHNKRLPKNIASQLQSRELGLGSYASGRGINKLHSTVYETLGPHLSITAGSGDVTNVAWSSNGEVFAAGCVALTDEHSMQYNQRNNLLLGDITAKKIRELPEHADARKLATSGANASTEMQASQDSLLFSTISAVQFSPDGTAMFSAGYDKVARVWDVRKNETLTGSIDDAVCVLEFQHRANIDLLAVNTGGIFATGTQRSASSIKVLRYDLDTSAPRTLKKLSLSSHRAQQRVEHDIVPSCMRWGYELYQQRKYLLCGFTSRANFGDGEICIWDIEAEQPTAIERGTRSVFDVAWSPTVFGRFAVGSTPDSRKVNRGTNSIVRIFDSRLLASSLNVNTSRTIELECPAMDMNDIVFNPSDPYLISTGCTDSVTYIWDLRNPDELLHQFSHGQSLTPLDESRSREDTDTGIRFLSWDHSQRQIYTGSSDGVVALWDPYVSPADSYVREVVQLNSGIMSGAFSPDFCNLLLGEVNGSISLLSVGMEDKTIKDFESFTLRPASEEALGKVRRRVGVESSVSPENPNTIGITAARALIQNSEIEIRDFGDMPVRQAVQGTRYAGPFDKAPDAPALRAKSNTFQTEFRPSKEPCKIRHEIPKITEEAQGDSRNWEMRIPERLRWPNTDEKVKGSSSQTGLVCFRCHETHLVPNAAEGVDVVVCVSCDLAWRVDVLGYTPVDVVTHTPLHAGAWASATGNKEAKPTTTLGTEASGLMDIDTDVDSEAEAQLADVTAWHHSFWKDRSPSPL